MTQAKRLEQLGISNSIARKEPLQGDGEVNDYGQRISTWGDFASKLWDRYPDLNHDQVYNLLGISNDPYDQSPQFNYFGDVKPDYTKRTVHNPNPFNLNDLKWEEMKRFEREVEPAFESEKDQLCQLVDQVILKLQDTEVEEDEDVAVVQELAEITEEFKKASDLTWSRSKDAISYDDVWHLPNSHPDRVKYRVQRDLLHETMDEAQSCENKVYLAQTKLQSIRDFGVAIPLSNLISEMYATDVNQDTGWDMRVTWSRALRSLVGSFTDERDISPGSKAGDVYVAREDVDKLKHFIGDSRYELQKYGEVCWKIVEPITEVPSIREHSLVTGVGVK